MDTKEYIIVATCLASGYRDVRSVIAKDADDAKEIWTKNESTFNIDVSSRYGDKVEVMDKKTYNQTKYLLITTPNGLLNNKTSNPGDNTVIPLTHATPQERAEYWLVISDESRAVRFAKANNVERDQVTWDENDNLVVLTDEELAPF